MSHPAVMRALLRQLRHSKASRNAAASYLAIVSTTVTGLISIPLAVHHLTKPELGLWAVITAVSGYLALAELGLGFATGRKMADAIIAKDREEVARWWTLTRAVLTVQGLMVIALGWALTPVFLGQMATDYPDPAQARFLLLAMVLYEGSKLPFHGAEGVLTAQERFHWVPLRQAFIFWFELAVFAACILSGLGLESMVWAKWATLILVWILNWILLSGSDPKLGLDFSGLRWDRLKSLFAFSLNVSGVSALDVVVRTLPVIIIGKLGGLALVPVYTLSVKISIVLVGIGKRNYQSFYPALQRMYIEGKHDAFRGKFSSVGLLTVATGLGIAGFVIAFNRMAVELLAKPEFYGGATATLWFAMGSLTTAVSGLMQIPLLAAGKMGKSVLVALARAVLAVGCCVGFYNAWGISGVAFIMAVVPVITGTYGFVRGARECGFDPWRLSGTIVRWMVVAGAAVCVIGSLPVLIPSEPIYSMRILGRAFDLPTWSELTSGGVLLGGAIWLFLIAFKGLRAPYPHTSASGEAPTLA